MNIETIQRATWLKRMKSGPITLERIDEQHENGRSLLFKLSMEQVVRGELALVIPKVTDLLRVRLQNRLNGRSRDDSLFQNHQKRRIKCPGTKPLAHTITAIGCDIHQI